MSSQLPSHDTDELTALLLEASRGQRGGGRPPCGGVAPPRKILPQIVLCEKMQRRIEQKGGRRKPVTGEQGRQEQRHDEGPGAVCGRSISGGLELADAAVAGASRARRPRHLRQPQDRYSPMRPWLVHPWEAHRPRAQVRERM
jgi:hypothetical protein